MSLHDKMIHSSAGADSSIEACLEEELHAIDLNDAFDDYADDDPDILLQNMDILKDLDPSADFEIPPELNDYLDQLEEQTNQLEKELLLCDEVLKESESKPTDEKSNAIVAYDDMKMLQDAAAEAGMTVEEFTQKVLKEVSEEEFTEDKLIQEYDEFIRFQKEMEDLRAGIEDTLCVTHDMDSLLAIEASKDETEVNQSNSDTGLIPLASTDAVTNYQNKYGFVSSDQRGGQLVSMNALSCMKEFIQEQLRKTEESYHSRQQILLHSIENHRLQEERQLMEEEERKKTLQQKIDLEQTVLLERKKERDEALEEELKLLDNKFKEDVLHHQTQIEQLTNDLETERTHYEAIRTHWMLSLEETKRKAATHIQKMYRGYRARKLNSEIIHKYEELKAVRKQERFNIRVMEVEYERKYQAEQAKKKKEAEEIEEKKRKEELEQQKQLELKRLEEEKRVAEEERKEAERIKEQEKLEEERKKREEEKKKEEERLRKEEEKQRKLEEKKKKEEEKRRLKEEERIRKEEEKRKKEEEKKKKEEEKKLKEEAERQRKEEKIKLEELRKLQEEENRTMEEEKESLEIEINNGSIAAEDEMIKSKEIEASIDLNLNSNNNNSLSSNTGEDVSPRIAVTSNLRPHPPLCPPPNAPAASWSPAPGPVQLATIKSLAPSDVPVPTVAFAPSQPDPIETLRVSWMKSCIPWSKVSNEPWKLVQSTQKVQKRPASAKKKFPPVAEAVVLSAAHAETLRQVSSVALCDLPGCSLSTLSQCWSLKYLTITHCNLVCLDSVSNCKHLVYVNAEYNDIEYVDLKDLGSLQVVKLAHNKLSAIHGLDGCINLRWLDLSSNNITKLGGLASLRRLHTLNVSYNQVISTESLEKVVTLQELDLSHNFLQQISDVQKLCLLTRLDLSSNNLLEVPELKNQVLLQILLLQKNSIKSLENLSKFWLPLLHTVNCSENMLESIDGLNHLIMLKHLDVSGNQITESDNLIQVLKCTKQLESLDLEGNPVSEVDKSGTSLLTSQLSYLRCFNGEEISAVARKDVDSNQELYKMCSAQITLHTTLRTELENQIKAYLAASKVSIELICQIHFSYCETSFRMATEHRSAHEYGCTDTFVPASKSNNIDALGADVTFLSNRDSDTSLNKHSTATVTNGSYKKTFSESNAVMSDNIGKKQNQALKKLASGTKSNLRSGKKLDSQPNKNSSIFSDSDSCDENFDVPAGSVGFSQQPPPSITAYINEKDKFNLALAGKVVHHTQGNAHVQNVNNSYSENEAVSIPSLTSASSNLQPNTSSTNFVSKKNLFEMALEKQNLANGGSHSSKEERFDAVSKGNIQNASDNNNQLPGLKSNAVREHIKQAEKSNWLNEIDLDQLVDMEGTSFDIDKYLEMDFELDEFLDLGWRPTDEPQVPHSSYPVLRKIQSNNDMSRVIEPFPPSEPVQAWRESNLTESKGRNSQQLNSHEVIPPLSHPSPVPSTVASAAETVESSRARSKMDEILQDWGFKDSHTAELMMARAKKMKYNAERKRKLSKLDPKQRLLLFRKLEESGKITSVRPPNVKTLPRKEYFQAREEEVIQQELLRQREDNSRINRTYEWIHTQVGDYPISSSRINPGHANNEIVQDKIDKFDYRKTSPMSDHKEPSVGRGSEKVGRRFSFGDENIDRSPLLPPIHKQDRISFRDSPVDKSVGWGGGKKRGQKL
ncbi:leucine-rich repeat and IQ domain-containing protein 1 [Biomphalaria glabrata]|nr:leucine-rich repeat and IQ domain-containing protein 1 [Biomphalaria glabrata]